MKYKLYSSDHTLVVIFGLNPLYPVTSELHLSESKFIVQRQKLPTLHHLKGYLLPERCRVRELMTPFHLKIIMTKYLWTYTWMN